MDWRNPEQINLGIQISKKIMLKRRGKNEMVWKYQRKYNADIADNR